MKIDVVDLLKTVVVYWLKESSFNSSFLSVVCFSVMCTYTRTIYI